MLYTNEAINKRINRKYIIKKTINIIGYILLFIILIYNSSLIVQAVLNPNKTPSFLGIKTYVIISGSMMPELNIGDIVIVKEIQEKELNKGNIISFRQGQSVITHRIVEIEKNNNEIIYYTRGDNNNTEDSSEVEYNSIEGKVIYKIPYIGKISLMLNGKLLIILILFIVYTYFSHISSVNKKKNSRRVKRLKYEEEKQKGKE